MPSCSKANIKKETHMTKAELIERIAMNNPHLYITDVERLVNTIFNQIKQALADGNRVELRGFGIFGVKNRPARTARNPKNGTEVRVLPKSIPYFKSGRVLKDRLNKKGN